MRFPTAKYVYKKTGNSVKLFVVLFSIGILIPSVFMLINVIKELQFKRSADQYLKTEFVFDNAHVVKQNYKYENDTTSIIEVFVLGEPLDSTLKHGLVKKKLSYGLEKTRVSIYESADNRRMFEMKIQEVNNESNTFREQLLNANKTIGFQEERIADLQYKVDSLTVEPIPVDEYEKELKILFPDLTSLKGGQLESMKDSSMMKTPIFLLSWDQGIYSRLNKEKNQAKISEWLKLKLKSDRLILMEE